MSYITTQRTTSKSVDTPQLKVEIPPIRPLEIKQIRTTTRKNPEPRHLNVRTVITNGSSKSRRRSSDLSDLQRKLDAAIKRVTAGDEDSPSHSHEASPYSSPFTSPSLSPLSPSPLSQSASSSPSEPQTPVSVNMPLPLSGLSTTSSFSFSLNEYEEELDHYRSPSFNPIREEEGEEEEEDYSTHSACTYYSDLSRLNPHLHSPHSSSASLFTHPASGSSSCLASPTQEETLRKDLEKERLAAEKHEQMMAQLERELDEACKSVSAGESAALEELRRITRLD
ncbi:hypothetical protein F5Y16DRAFT_396867 [Xylariaceae sp. FL0255]|nr:hypothetical protein F5Y16DRAFT_396867 [Xylariaceae sp. FL0255]